MTSRLVLFSHSANYNIHVTQIFRGFTPRKNAEETGLDTWRHPKKSLHITNDRETGTTDLKKFNFAIIGTAKAEQKEHLEAFLKIVMSEHLDPGNPSLNEVMVLTGEE